MKKFDIKYCKFWASVWFASEADSDWCVDAKKFDNRDLFSVVKKVNIKVSIFLGHCVLSFIVKEFNTRVCGCQFDCDLFLLL